MPVGRRALPVWCKGCGGGVRGKGARGHSALPGKLAIVTFVLQRLIQYKRREGELYRGCLCRKKAKTNEITVAARQNYK